MYVVCMYVCSMYVCMYLCMYVCMYVCREGLRSVFTISYLKFSKLVLTVPSSERLCSKFRLFSAYVV